MITEYLHLSYKDSICYIIGLEKLSFCFLVDRTIRIEKESLYNMLLHLKTEERFIKINRNMIINTFYFVRILNKKERAILMRTGEILNVSRKYWINFK